MEDDPEYKPQYYEETMPEKIRFLMMLRTFEVDRGLPPHPQSHPDIKKSLRDRMECIDKVYSKALTILN